MQDNSSKDQLNLPVDKGWEQMSAQLDEVMPQRRRRFVWWWLPLLLLIGFVVSYAWSQLGISIPTENTGEQQELIGPGPVAEEKVAPKPTDNKEKTENLADLINSETTPNLIQSTNASQTSIPTESTTPLTLSSENLVEETVIATTEALRDESSPLTTASENLAETTQAGVATTPEQTNPIFTSVPDEEVIQEETRPFYEVAPLTGKPTALLNTPTGLVAFEERLVSSAPKVRWYTEGLASSALGDPYSSLIAGVGAERSIGQSLLVNAGLQYQYSRSVWFNDEAGVAFVGTSASGSNDLVNGGIYDIAGAYQNLRTQRTNAYLRAAYRVHPRLHLGLGAQASYFVRASANITGQRSPEPESHPNLDSDAVRVNLYDDLVEAVSLEEFNNGAIGPVPLEVRRWQWSVMGTLSYRWHPAWSLEAQYVRHLTAWPAEGEVFGGPHNVQLGLRYYFRK